MADRMLLWIATLGPVGHLPAPGTAGSFVAVLLGLACINAFSLGGFVAATALVAVIGLSAAGAHYRRTGQHDAGAVVIDEVVGQWLAMMAIPLAPDFSLPYLAAVACSFLLFRLFDILKPGPIRRAESLPGAAGVMADDVLAGIAAGVVVFMAASLWEMIP
ncbi:phosphatidylglycerophosphatase A [Alphaproteobacteria bacterium LSUCC0684]